MSRPVFGFVPAAPFIAPALPVAVPAVAGAAVAGIGLAASLPVLVAVGAGLAGGFLLGAGLAQLWGRAAGPSRSVPVSLADGTTFEVTTSTQQTYAFRLGYRNYERETRCDNGATSVYTGGTSAGTLYTRQCHGIRIVSPGSGFYASGCGVAEFVAKFGYAVTFNGSSWNTAEVGGWGGSRNKQADKSVVYEWSTWIAELTIGGVPYVPPGVPIDWIGASSVSDFKELPTAPAPKGGTVSPSYLPFDVYDQTLVGEPLTEADIGNAAAPALPPLIAPTFWPVLAPAGRPIAADGNLVPLPPALPATTPADVHFPVPGGSPVGGLAQSPPATLAGIAAEVGRIEAKLNRLLNPLAPGDSTDLLQLLWQAIQALYNSMADNRPAGEYLLSTPCELDEDGDRIVSSVGYPETSDNTAAVLARIDALAALLQTHKDLKQPICRQTPAVGQPVQVQFVQIE